MPNSTLIWGQLRCETIIETHLYLDQQAAQAYAHLRLSVPFFFGAVVEPATGYLPANTQLLWDGRNFTLINMGETTITLLPEVGEPLQVPSAFFLRLLDARAIVVPSSGKFPLEREEAKARMNAASEADRRIANERFRFLNECPCVSCSIRRVTLRTGRDLRGGCGAITTVCPFGLLVF